MANPEGKCGQAHEFAAVAQCRAPAEVLNLPVTDIGLNERFSFPLFAAGFKTVRDLVVASDDDLLAVKSIGYEVLAKIRARLLDLGTSLQEGVPHVDKSILKSFLATQDSDYRATNAAAGTREKLDVITERVRSNLPLWHVDDKQHYDGLTGAIRPRD